MSKIKKKTIVIKNYMFVSDENEVEILKRDEERSVDVFEDDKGGNYRMDEYYQVAFLNVREAKSLNNFLVMIFNSKKKEV